MRMAEHDSIRVQIELSREVAPDRIVSRLAGCACHALAYDAECQISLLRCLRRISSAASRLACLGDIHASRAPESEPPRRPRAKDLATIGARLSPYVFGGAVGATVRSQLTLARQSGRPLVVELTVRDPELRILPWETAAIADDANDAAGPLCWCRDVRLVRHGHAGDLRHVNVAGRLQVGMVVEDPSPGTALEHLRARLLWAQYPNLFIEEPLLAQGWSRIAWLLPASGWNVLIFGGHVHTENGEAHLGFTDGNVPARDFV